MALWWFGVHHHMSWCMVRSLYLPACQLLPVSSQNALIRELDHTKKLIEESHHEKVRDRLLTFPKFMCFFSGGELELFHLRLQLKQQMIIMSVTALSYRSSSWSRLRRWGRRMSRVGAGATPYCTGKPVNWWVSQFRALTSQSLSDCFFKICFSRRSQLGSTPDFRYPVSASSMMDSNSDHYGSALVLRRPQKGRMAALRDEPSKVSSQLM